jgi:cyclophilin family peptidyl-prolyl cis-trans isomerase
MIRASRRRERGRRRSSSSNARRTTYIVALVIALVLVFGTVYYIYVYSQGGKTTSTTTSPLSSGSGLVYAKLVTSQGTIEVELYQNSAPKTVANFVQLAQSGFYSNLVWHRIAAGFVIQTGDPNSRNALNNRTWGQGNGPQTVPLEIDPSLHNVGGTLGMARGTDVNSGSSQFFINLTDNTASLDGKYTVFGKVISGMNVVDAIAGLPVLSTSQPTDPSQAMLLSVTISNTP